MREPTSRFPSLLHLLNLESKRDVVRHCARLIVHRQDLVGLIVAAQHGALHPYRYANHVSDRLSENLYPNEAEREAIAKNGVGPFRTNAAKKFMVKLGQLHRERRALAAHIFYTPSHRYWHLFYFDNRDTSESKNHWKHGSHIHYVSDLWPTLSLRDAWSQVTSGKLAIPSIHVRHKK